jgi:hypothetical protein
MKDELKRKLQQLAHKAQENTLERVTGLLDGAEVISQLIGSNGVVLLTESNIVFSLGSGAIYRTGEIPIDQARMQVQTMPGDLLQSLIFGFRDKEHAQRLTGAGDAAESFLADYERTLERFIYRRSQISVDPDSGTEGAAPGLLVRLALPADADQLVTLLERLGQLHRQGLLSQPEFERCKMLLIGHGQQPPGAE